MQSNSKVAVTGSGILEIGNPGFFTIDNSNHHLPDRSRRLILVVQCRMVIWILKLKFHEFLKFLLQLI